MPKGRQQGSVLRRGQRPPSPPVRGLRDCCKLCASGVRGRARAEVGFSLLWGFKNQQFGSTTHYSPAILTVNFNDFAFTLGMTVFDQVGLKSQRGWSIEQVGLSPLPLVIRHFNYCFIVRIVIVDIYRKVT